MGRGIIATGAKIARTRAVLRILLAVHAFPPRSTAGVEVYTLRLARALRELGHEARVLAARHDLAAEPSGMRERLHEGVPVVEVNNVHDRGTLRATWDAPGIARAFAAHLEAWRPDVVHFQHLLNLSAALPAEAKRRGMRTLLTLHDYWADCPRDGLRIREDLVRCERVDHAVCARCLRTSPYLTPALQRGVATTLRAAGLGAWLHRFHRAAPRLTEAVLRGLRRASPPGAGLERELAARREGLREAWRGVDLFLAPTAFARDRALEAGLPKDRMRVQALGAVVGPARPRPAGPRPRLGFVGTLAPHKGVHLLVEAFLGVPAPEARLEIFGSPAVLPSYAARLGRAAAGDARIRFRGPFPEGGQDEALRDVDALVLPSVWWENSPLTALEALAAGRPVVASRIGGVPEIVPEGAGRLVPPGDVPALRAALADVVAGRSLAQALDPLPLVTVAAGARALVELYAGGLTSSA